MKVRILAKPGARHDTIERRDDGVLIVRVKQRAVDGKANNAICALLAKEFNCSTRDITIRSGSSARMKTVEISR